MEPSKGALDHPALAAETGAVGRLAATPGLTYHYEVADGSEIDPVAVTLLRALLDAGIPGRETMPSEQARAVR